MNIKALAAGAFVGVFLAGNSVHAVSNDDAEFTPSQTKSIEAIVKDYLLKNPEILIDMSQSLERKQEARRARSMERALVDNADTLFRSSTDAVFGNPDGDVTLVEFSDYNCPYCRSASEHVRKIMRSDNNVRVVFKELVLFGEDSEAAARASLAAARQGKLLEMRQGLMAGRERNTKSRIMKIAKNIGLDVAKLQTDMESSEISKKIEETKALAAHLGIRGTPAYFIDNQMIPGAPSNLYEQFVEKIATARKNSAEKGKK
jgi:protein-disulfide isomerase